MKRKKSVRHEKIKSFRAWALVMPWDKVVDSHFQEGADANIYEIFDRKTCDEDANKNLIRVEIRQVNIIRKKRP